MTTLTERAQHLAASGRDVNLQVLQPSRTTVMVKPVGALCNLDCTYCYDLPAKGVFGGVNTESAYASSKVLSCRCSQALTTT